MRVTSSLVPLLPPGDNDAPHPSPPRSPAVNTCATRGGKLCQVFTAPGMKVGGCTRRGRIHHSTTMKRYAPFVLLATVLLVVLTPLLAATAAPPSAGSDRSPVAPIATAISTVTGIAISPLLGTSAYGAYKYFTAKDAAAREALPWYSKMSFWLPALLLVAVCAAKDAFGTVVPPGLKNPLDVL